MRSSSRRRRLRRAAALAGACAVAAVLAVPAEGHQGDARYRSVVEGISPAADGLSVRVLQFDDRVLLVNGSGEDVVVQGYDEEPYVRIAADGTVAVNRGSPAAYLNDDRYAHTGVPDGVAARPDARPRWEVVGRTGRFEWHDHRIHWMARGLPPQVTDASQDRTRVLDWAIPLTIGGRPASVTGTLWWVGEEDGDGVPVAATVVLVPLAAGAVLLVRRRRRAGAVTPW